MPDWITALLGIASWPARQIAMQNDYDQTGWQYLLGVFVLYMFEAALAALAWYEVWLRVPGLARRIGKWTARSGSIQSMKSAETAVAEIERVCSRLRRFAGIAYFSSREPRDERVPGDGASRWKRTARFLVRQTFGLVSGFTSFAKSLVRFMIRPWGFLFLVASVATVYPNAIPDAIASVGEFVNMIPWTNQLITNVAAILGVLVAVGVVVVKGFLSDRVSARRHVQDARNLRALESIAPLFEPLEAVSYYGMMELETICARVKWQLVDAERWINRKVTAKGAAERDKDHLACDEDCPQRSSLSTESGRVFKSVELTKAFEEIDQICGKGNPLDTWSRELGRLCNHRERSTMYRLKYGNESLSERVKTSLFFLADDEFKKVRRKWQHSCSTMLLDEESGLSPDYITHQRKRNLERLAAEYRRLMWHTLQHLRICEEMAEIAWRANGPSADQLAKVSR